MTSRVNSWRARGSVYLWRYRDNTRNFSGWHLNTDRVGGASLLDLLSALEAEGAAAHRTVPLAAPTFNVLRVPNNQGGRARIWAPSKWRLAYDPTDPHRWEFPIGSDPAVLTMGLRTLTLVARGVSDLMGGGGDYSICHTKGEAPSESTQLWFWW